MTTTGKKKRDAGAPPEPEKMQLPQLRAAIDAADTVYGYVELMPDEGRYYRIPKGELRHDLKGFTDDTEFTANTQDGGSLLFIS